MDQTKNSELKDTLGGQEAVLATFGSFAYLWVLPVTSIAVLILVWFVVPDRQVFYTLLPLFILPSITVVAFTISSAKKTTVDAVSLTSTYAFMKSRSFTKNLSDCTGYFSYFLFRQAKGSTIKQYGLVMKWNDGKTSSAIVGATKDRTALDATIVRLRAAHVPQVAPNLQNAAAEIIQSDMAYPLVVNVLDVKGLAEKTFKDPSYNPTFLV